MLEILTGMLPEAIYFALFIIICKKKRIFNSKFLILTALSIFQYLTIKYFLPFNSWFQFIYLICMFINANYLWKDNRIIDLFIVIFGLVNLVIISTLTFVIFQEVNLFTNLIQKILLFSSLIIYVKIDLESLYTKYWNRQDKVKKKIKSITFRTINILIINILFIVVNMCMIYAIIYNGR